MAEQIECYAQMLETIKLMEKAFKILSGGITDVQERNRAALEIMHNMAELMGDLETRIKALEAKI